MKLELFFITSELKKNIILLENTSMNGIPKEWRQSQEERLQT